MLAFESESKAGTVLLLECPVNKAEYAGNSGYFYRTHKLVHLERIPTLLKFTPDEDEIFKHRLIEEECQNASLLSKLFVK